MANNMNRIFFISFILIGISCIHFETRSDLEIFVERSYNDCLSEECHVDFSKFKEGSWDTMYLFGPAASDDLVDDSLGFKFDHTKDVGRLLIFTKDKHYSYYQIDIDYEKPYYIDFGNISYFKYYYDESIFSVIKKDSGYEVMRPHQ